MAAGATTTEVGSQTAPATVRVWDPLVRLFHWSLLAAFTAAFISAEEWERGHVTIGYIVAGLVAFRLVWGVIGSKHARFSDFIYRPRTVIGYIRESIALKAKRYIGHNPAGGAMVIALLLAITGISVTGYMMGLDAFWGVQWIEELHEGLVNMTLVLVALHVVGVVFASFEHGENLIKSMITGRKRR
jgi:cytochrome b